MKKTLFLFMALLFISCGKEEPPPEGEGYLSEIPTIPVQETRVYDDAEFPVFMPHRVAVRNGYAVVSDGKTWKLHLFNEEGEPVHSAGGLGRGPGEFNAINQMHFGADGRLYVYDAVLHKVSAFIIEDEQLVHDQEIALPSYGAQFSTSLKSIHVTDSGTIGVFKEISPPEEEPNVFEVYRLADDFEQEELLSTIPGNAFMIHNGRRAENHLGSTTMWNTVGDEFYYLQSVSFTTSVMNVSTGTVREVAVHATPENNKTSAQVEFLTTKYSMMQGNQFQPSIDEMLEELDSLPLVSTFFPTEQYIYYGLHNFSDDPGADYLLSYDKATGEMGKIPVSTQFAILAAEDNRIYGVDHSEMGNIKLMMVEH